MTTDIPTIRAALIGSKGMLAGMVRRLAPERYGVIPLDLPELDITDRDQVLKTMEEFRPGVILNCAAFTDVDGCETKEDLANRVNGEGPGNLAEAARETGATLVHISTDYVFDGSKSRPYTEEDLPGPRSAYGRSKLLGERAIEASGLEEYFIIRTSWLYGPGGKNFVETILRLAGEREEIRVVNDQVGSPTYTGDLASAMFDLLALEAPHPSPLTPRDPFGLYHYSNEGECSWHGFAEEIVRMARLGGMDLKVRSIVPIRTEEYPLPARRPAFSLLSKEKFRRVTGKDVPQWRDGLKHYLKGKGLTC